MSGGGRAYAWRRVDLDDGMGWGAIRPSPAGLEAHGHEIAAERSRSWSVTFAVRLGPDWRTLAAWARVQDGDGEREVRLDRDARDAWRVNGNPTPQLDGCLDVDVAATPLTNTFPIRRLMLPVGGSRDISAAWIRVPQLDVRRLDQRYTRLEAEEGVDRYEYRSLLSDRAWSLTVDPDGVVIDYAGFAHRVAP